MNLYTFNRFYTIPSKTCENNKSFQAVTMTQNMKKNELGITFISEIEDHWGNPHEICPQKTQLIPFLWSV